MCYHYTIANSEREMLRNLETRAGPIYILTHHPGNARSGLRDEPPPGSGAPPSQGVRKTCVNRAI